jgi:hypothetical protein
MVSWRPWVLSAGKWSGSDLYFGTEVEAKNCATLLWGRWIGESNIRVTESDEAINHRLVDGVWLEEIE